MSQFCALQLSDLVQSDLDYNGLSGDTGLLAGTLVINKL